MGFMVIVLVLVYICYGLAKECELTGGSTESILLIIKSVFVTIISFQDISGAIVGTIITIFFAVMAYKFWIANEKKTDLFEIIFLCIESIILSIIVSCMKIDGIGIFLFILFEETAIYMLNYLAKYIFSCICNEQEEY